MAEPGLEGRRVVLAGTAEDELIEATVAAFSAAGATVERLVGADPEVPSALDVGICFARPGVGLELRELDEPSADAALRMTLGTPLRTVLGMARTMAAGAGGALVVVGTLDLYHAYAGRALASVAMGGLLGLVRAIAVESSSQRVRANLVAAGPLATGTAVDDASPLVQRTLLRSPMHRLGKPDEVAAAIRFVAGPDSGFMTGQTLRVDGGWASLNQAPEGMRFP